MCLAESTVSSIRLATGILAGFNMVNGSNWDTAKNDIMKDLITKKFTDSDELKAELLATGNKAMVECGRDPYYACGLPIVHKDIFNQEKWTGKNVLGNILCTVRDIIRNG